MQAITVKGGFLDIVFDGPPEHESGRFVECEVDGRSVNVGEWIEDGDGLWRLRLPWRPGAAVNSTPPWLTEVEWDLLAALRAARDCEVMWQHRRDYTPLMQQIERAIAKAKKQEGKA